MGSKPSTERRLGGIDNVHHANIMKYAMRFANINALDNKWNQLTNGGRVIGALTA